jgi:uncharacterized protein
MIYIAIGLIVGIIMGLTGAGGAMVSIPLFIGLLNTSLKEATILSLVAVVFGTAVNLFSMLSKIHKKIAVTLSLAGAVANYVSLPLKNHTPDWLIAGLLAIIGSYSIWSVWRRDENQNNSLEKDSFVIPKGLVAGAFLGLITTLTGLGGGVILVPLLIRFFKKSYEEALPTSLGTILLISLTSFILQSKTAFSLISFTDLSLLGSGAFLSFIILKLILKNINDNKILQARRVVFTTVTIYSVISVIMKAI